MIKIRTAKTIYQANGEIENGIFSGKWHFSFDQYYDPEFEHFGALRVFNDDTLSPGAVWPLHPHKRNEVVTYIADGEFRHEDEHGLGGILKKGWVQHTTVGTGMWHSEINNKKDEPMRFIQIWFTPDKLDHKPSVEQKQVDIEERTNKFLPLISNTAREALKIKADVEVYSLFITKDKSVSKRLTRNNGYYLYALECGPIKVNTEKMSQLDAAMIKDESVLDLKADEDTEILLLNVGSNI